MSRRAGRLLEMMQSYPRNLMIQTHSAWITHVAKFQEEWNWSSWPHLICPSWTEPCVLILFYCLMGLPLNWIASFPRAGFLICLVCWCTPAPTGVPGTHAAWYSPSDSWGGELPSISWASALEWEEPRAARCWQSLGGRLGWVCPESSSITQILWFYNLMGVDELKFIKLHMC